MLAVLVALRDLLLVMALSWVGVTFEPQERPRAPSCGGGDAVCTTGATAFDALECAKR